MKEEPYLKQSPRSPHLPDPLWRIGARLGPWRAESMMDKRATPRGRSFQNAGSPKRGRRSVQEFVARNLLLTNREHIRLPRALSSTRICPGSTGFPVALWLAL